ncbi:MAG: hypothetical protein ACTJH9_08925 [Pseudoalteromonas sp.]|uniref:hypothetical protein n=1 Tax=unclassified Pseudoalteromonas TaxID=194690 RepID=UPI003F995618
MNTVLIAYLLIFALFGTAASYFVRFIYAYWVKNQMPIEYIFKACACIVVVIVISALMPLLA